MTAQWPVVAGTGHRPQHLGPDAREWIHNQLPDVARQLRDHHGTTAGISGLALGFDTSWAQAILNVGLDLWAYVPFPQQADRWPADADRVEWRRLLNAAAQVRVFGDLTVVAPARRRAEAARLLHVRNDGLLEADGLVACWSPRHRQGGTFSAVRKAARLGLPGIHLDPAARTVTVGLPDPDTGRVLRCGGRAVNDRLQPVGDACTERYERRSDVPDAVALMACARAAGWSVATLPDGMVAATCPRCRRPDPSTVALCLDLETSITQPAEEGPNT